MDLPIDSTEPAHSVPDPAPIPPGLPPLERPERLLWWQGLLGMLLAIVMLVVANLGVVFVLLLAQGGVARVREVAADASQLNDAIATFPLIAAGQVANLFVFLVVAALVPLVARVPYRSALGLGGAPWGAFALGAVGILGLAPLADRVVKLLKPFFPERNSLEMIEAAIRGQPLWLLVPFLAVMPALGEELLCRGVLQRSVRSPWLALPLSAVLFAALHMDPLHMAGVLPLGFYLAWLGHVSGSVWVPVAAHFMNNLAATLAMVASETLPTDDTDLPLVAVPMGLGVTLVCAYGLQRVMQAQGRPGEQLDELPD